LLSCVYSNQIKLISGDNGPCACLLPQLLLDTHAAYPHRDGLG